MKRLLKLSLMVILAGGFVGGLILIKRNQDSRGRASYSGADLMMVSEVTNINIGQTTSVAVVVSTGTSKLTGFDLTIRFDKTKLRVALVRPTTFELVRTEIDQNNGKVRVVGITGGNNPDNFLIGAVRLVRIDFEGVATGSSQIIVESEAIPSILTGYNPNGDDQDLGITSISGIDCVISGGGITSNPYMCYGKFGTSYDSGACKIGSEMKITDCTDLGLSCYPGSKSCCILKTVSRCVGMFSSETTCNNNCHGASCVKITDCANLGSNCYIDSYGCCSY